MDLTSQLYVLDQQAGDFTVLSFANVDFQWLFKPHTTVTFAETKSSNFLLSDEEGLAGYLTKFDTLVHGEPEVISYVFTDPALAIPVGGGFIGLGMQQLRKLIPWQGIWTQCGRWLAARRAQPSDKTKDKQQKDKQKKKKF